MLITRRDLILPALPIAAALVCRPAKAVSGTPQTAQGLRDKITGRLYTPTDAGYDSARRGLGPTPVTDRFPALVVQPESPDDIARTLEFARTHDLEVSVRSGGHDAFGASTTASGVVIDLCRMAAIRVDAATGTARAGAGARAGALTAAGGPLGLAPVLGTLGQVGLGGLTLGGGIGWLCGSYGAAVDHLLAVEMVTADGRFVQASARNHPELFWGLRGGGGNFGVATAFTYQLQTLAQVLGGTLVFKTDIARFLRFLHGFLAESPDALDLVVVLPLQPRRTVTVRLCWSGDPAEGERVVAALKAFSPPVVDTIKPQAYHSFVETGGPPPFENQFWRGGEFDGLSESAIDALAAVLDRGGPEGCAIGILHYMHGALCRTPVGSTPFIRQSGHILYNVATSWHGTTAPQEKLAWVLDAAERFRPVNSAQTYINYLSYEGAAPVRDAYGSNFKRLAAIKNRYDPHNVFHNNRNIRRGG